MNTTLRDTGLDEHTAGMRTIGMGAAEIDTA